MYIIVSAYSSSEFYTSNFNTIPHTYSKPRQFLKDQTANYASAKIIFIETKRFKCIHSKIETSTI